MYLEDGGCGIRETEDQGYQVHESGSKRGTERFGSGDGTRYDSEPGTGTPRASNRLGGL